MEVFWGVFCFFVLMGSIDGQALAPEAQSCLACHGQADIAPDPRLHGFEESVHRRVSCLSCHSNASEIPHGPSMVGKEKQPQTCGACHKEEALDFGASVHGKALARGLQEAPACTDCHGEHTIRSPSAGDSSAWRGAITKTCSGCHANERITAKFGLPTDRVVTYLDSYHGLAGRSGGLKAAHCASCHGWHDVLPSHDPKSRVHPANLPATCGRCHEGAGPRLARAKIHVALASKGGGSRIAALARLFYLFLIPLTAAAMFFHNILDLARKMANPHKAPPLRLEENPMLTVFERFQHAALILFFFILAYSGFALEYPDSLIAAPFPLLGGEGPRMAVHRSAAFGFAALAAVHIAYLVFTRRGRERARALWLCGRDIRDPVKLMKFNLGLSKERPVFERFSYIEKAEYWALAWGSGIMIVTGALLVFHNAALARFPLWVIETGRVIHFMEAVLACLAILIWHFYWVMLDPEIYPMNWSWLLGRSRFNERKD